MMKQKIRVFSTFPILFLLLAASTRLPAQPAELEGTWEGILTQNSGGYASEYHFGLILTIKKGYVDGRSFVFLETGEVSNEMELMGLWKTGDVLYFRENRILKSNKPEFLEWCYKSGELRLVREIDGKWRLEGPWWGESASGVCIPGFVRLTKVVPRA